MINSYYGGYRTRTFADIFPSYTTFENEYDNSTLSTSMANQESVQTLYYLLYARYGNSHIAFTDENQFKYSIFSIMFMYGPTWEKRLDIQKKLRNLSEDELMRGGKAIYNHAFNPSTNPSTATLEELPAINDQNTTNYKKSKLESYSMLMGLLETDVTEEFIGKFKKLFLTIVAPDYPLLYETTINTEEIE